MSAAQHAESVATGVGPAGGGVAARTPMQIAGARLRRDRVALAGAGFIVLLIAFALAAPLIARLTDHPVQYINVAAGIDDQGRPVGIGVNDYLLGAVDLNGHDMLVWLAYGARISLFIGIVSTILVLAISLVLGLVAGFYGGWVDTGISRVIEILAAFPFLLFAIALTVVFGRGHLWLVIGIIVFFSWFYPARIFRSEILALREREFVEAARSLGASNWRIMRVHLLPHLVPPAIVYGTLSVAVAISFEAAISFLGFGLTIETPSWGQMINFATQGGLYRLEPRLMFLPGTLLFLTVLAFNLLGDGLRDALDPKGGVGA